MINDELLRHPGILMPNLLPPIRLLLMPSYDDMSKCTLCLFVMSAIIERPDVRYNCPFWKTEYDTGHAIPFRKLLQLKSVRDREKR